MRKARHRIGHRGRFSTARPAAAILALSGLAGAVGLVAATVVASDASGPGTRKASARLAPAGSGSTSASWTPSRMVAATPLTPPPFTPSAESDEPDKSDDPSRSYEATPSTPTEASAGPAPAKTVPPIARKFAGTPAVGVLFFTDKTAADHYCTASVVHSPAGDLAITAAHCVYSAADGGYMSDIAFVPGYNGGSPYGQWTPSRIVVAPGWAKSADPDLDVGFLVLNRSASGAVVESVTGADRIAFGTGFGQSATVPAYPQGSVTPVICTAATVARSATQTEFDCGGYPGGTSGAPFLTAVDATGARGTVVGVIGGYQEGGDTPSVSYSAYFGSGIAALYQTAEAAG